MRLIGSDRMVFHLLLSGEVGMQELWPYDVSMLQSTSDRPNLANLIDKQDPLEIMIYMIIHKQKIGEHSL